MSPAGSKGSRGSDSAFEQRLVARLQAGETEAISTLFDLHVDAVYAYARHFLGNREDAEEVTSEAFLRALSRVAAFRGDCPFRGWLFGIARNLCLDRKRQPRLLPLDDDWADTPAAPDHSAASDTRIVVQSALAQLPDDQRMALILCDVQEHTAPEVAHMLDRSLDATKSLLYRARRSLKARLKETWCEEADDAV